MPGNSNEIFKSYEAISRVYKFYCGLEWCPKREALKINPRVECGRTNFFFKERNRKGLSIGFHITATRSRELVRKVRDKVILKLYKDTNESTVTTPGGIVVGIRTDDRNLYIFNCSSLITIRSDKFALNGHL